VADFPGFIDFFRSGRDEALIRQAALTREAIERDGTDANVLTAGGAAAADEVMGQLISVQAGLFIDSAKGPVLRRLLFDRYSLLAKEASNAVGQVQFTLPTPNLAPFVIPASTLLETGTGVQFITAGAVNFPAGSQGPVTVTVRSVLAGLDQQAAPGLIANIVSDISGAPTGLTVTNALATAGADDEEQDDSLRARGRAFFTTARKGTLAAIVQGALAVPGVRTAQAFEAISSTGAPDRFVQLVVADAYTDSLAQLGAVPPAYALQSQAFAITVFGGLDDVRAAGINVQVVVASLVLLSIVLHLTFQAGAANDPTAATAAAKAVAVQYTNNLVPGQVWDPAELLAFLRTVPGLQITGNEVASPNGRVVPTPLQVIRTTLAIVTAPAV
jgi:uncharacterized phage protein gp47/JayE